MTNYYTKELSTDNQKKGLRFAEEVQKIKADTSQLKEQQDKANKRIPEIKTELSRLVTDVEVITNDSKRRKVLKDKAKLQDELNELELYSVMDIDRYKDTRLDAIYELGLQAAQEYRDYTERTKSLLSAAKKEYNEKEQEVMTARNSLHPFVMYQNTVNTLRQKKRVAEIEKEQEEESKKTIHVDSSGNEIVGKVSWK